MKGKESFLAFHPSSFQFRHTARFEGLCDLTSDQGLKALV
jgi:hypothetical protein